MSSRRSRKAFPITVVLTLIVSLLPARWLAKLNDLGTIVSFPLMPLRDGANFVAAMMAPDPPRYDDHDADASRDQLYAESQAWRQRYLQSSLQVKFLEDQLEQLQAIPIERLGPASIKPLTARITGLNPSEPSRVVELNRGARQGVVPGTVAVYDGSYLVGRVRDVSEVRCVMVPLTADSTGFILARIASSGAVVDGLVGTPVVQLKARGDGSFTADVARDLAIAEGDTVWLDDRGWPRTAQAMIVGSVRSVRAKDDQPLRNTIVVRPYQQIHQLSSVTLVIELDDAGEEPTS
jgi:cell shape-determining protein MreC